MKEIWNRIEAYLSKHVPSVIGTLNSPATEAELNRLETEIDHALPDDFRSFLLVHNGQNDPSRLQTLCEEGTFLCVETIISTYRMLNAINESGDMGPVEWWSRKYLPITDCEGDHLALNLETGEVVMHVHNSGIEEGIAPSFKTWFESKLLVFERGEFSVEGGYLNYWECSK